MRPISPRARLRLHVLTFACSLLAVTLAGRALFLNRRIRQRIEALSQACTRLEQRQKQSAK